MRARSYVLLGALALAVAGVVLAAVFVLPRREPAAATQGATRQPAAEATAQPASPEAARQPSPPPARPPSTISPETVAPAAGAQAQGTQAAQQPAQEAAQESPPEEQPPAKPEATPSTQEEPQVSALLPAETPSQPEVVASLPAETPSQPEAIAPAAAAKGPLLTLLSPIGQTAYGSIVSVTGKVSGPEGSPDPLAEIASVSWAVEGTRLGGAIQLGKNGSFDFSFSTVGMRGDFTVSVRAQDRNGRSAQSSVMLSDRTSGPSLAIDSPLDRTEYSGDVTVAGRAGDPADPSGSPAEVKSLTWRVVGRQSLAGNVARQDDGAFRFSFSTEGLSGTQVLELKAVDLNGRGTTRVITLVQPTVAQPQTSTTASQGPALSILFPLDNSLYGAAVTVSGTVKNSVNDASADAITGVTWSLTGTTLSGNADVGRDGGFSFTVHTVGLHGAQALSVKAASRAGGTAESVIVLLEDERGLPITITSPPAGGYYQDITVIEGRAGQEGSAGGLKALTYDVTGTEGLTGRVVTNTDGTFKLPLSLSKVTGDITVSLVSEDMNGHQARSALTLHDGRLKPSIVLASPLKGSSYGTLIRVAGTVSDPYAGQPGMEGIDSLSWLLSPVDFSKTSTPARGTTPLGPGGAFRFSLPTATLSGAQDFTLTAVARNGSRSENTIRLTQGEGDLSSFSVLPADRTVMISWDPVPFAVRYDLSWTSGSDAPEKGQTMKGVSSPVKLTGLENGTLYALRVQVIFDDAGTGASAVTRVIPLSPQMLAPLVTGDYQQIHLSWDRISGATAYDVWRSAAAAGDYVKIAAALSSAVYVDTAVEFGKEYTYEIAPAGPLAPRSAPVTGRSLAFPAEKLVEVGTAPIRDARRVTVNGGYAFIASGVRGVRIVDVSSPAAPVVVGEMTTTDAWDVAVRSNYAYVADGESGLRVLDIAAPREPLLISSRKTTDARAVVLSGDYAFVADGDKGLKVIDITDTRTLNRVATLETTNAQGLALDGNRLFIADGAGGLLVVDITRPRAPAVKATLALADARGVAVEGGIAAVAAGAAGLCVVDVSGAIAPTLLATFSTGMAASVALVSGFAYVADGKTGIKVVDLEDPAHPSLFTSHSAAGAAHVSVGDRYAYIADAAGLDLLRVQIQGRSFRVASCETGGKAYSVFVAGDWAYVAGHAQGIRVVNVSDPGKVTDASLAGALSTRFAIEATVQDKFAYVADGTNGVRIVDVSPSWGGKPGSAPVDVGAYRPGGMVSRVAANGTVAYVAAGNQGIRVLNVSTPSAPVEIGSVRTTNASDIMVRDAWAFVADGDGGLRVVDVSDPARPTVLPAAIRGNARCLALTENLLLVAGASGVSIVDVSDPKAPVLKGRYETSSVEAIAVNGKYAYVAEGYRGLTVLDISRPSRPAVVSACDDVFAVGVAVKGGYAIVADSFGLRIIQILIPDWLSR